jgi:hypothetical protein
MEGLTLYLVRGTDYLPRSGRGGDPGSAGHTYRVGETVHAHRGILAMLQARSADVMTPDLQRMGGPTEFSKAGHLCEAFHAPCPSH